VDAKMCIASAYLCIGNELKAVHTFKLNACSEVLDSS
jgi:hypothetical protein